MGKIMKDDIILTGSTEFPFHKYECIKVALRISKATDRWFRVVKSKNRYFG